MQASVSRPVLIDAVLPRAAMQSRAHRIATDVALMIGFAGLVALTAQVAFRIPWTTVPITGQTFGVLVAGGALGARRGGGAMLLYMLMGIIGLPVLAPSASALGMEGSWAAHFILPWKGITADPWGISSGGYVVGFVLAAALTGHLAQRAWDRKPHSVLAMLAGSVAIYVPGVLWLWYLIASGWVPAGASQPLAEFIAGGGSLDKALNGGLYPFIVGDVLKLLLASLTLPAAWALVNRLKKGDSEK